MPAFGEDRQFTLQPNLYGNVAYFYKEPNPALSEALMGPRLQAITADYTARVGQTYVDSLRARRPQAGDDHRGAMAQAVTATVEVGGYKTDRFIGQIVVKVPYAMADEFGRKSPAPGQNHSTYQGSGALRAALYAHLPPI